MNDWPIIRPAEPGDVAMLHLHLVELDEVEVVLGRPGMHPEDLYVRPEHRGNGLGQAIFAHLAELAVQRGCARLEWWVLRTNEPALRF